MKLGVKIILLFWNLSLPRHLTNFIIIRQLDTLISFLCVLHLFWGMFKAKMLAFKACFCKHTQMQSQWFEIREIRNFHAVVHHTNHAHFDGFSTRLKYLYSALAIEILHWTIDFVVCYGLLHVIYPLPSGLLHCDRVNRTDAPLQVKLSWWIWMIITWLCAFLVGNGINYP